MSILRRIFRKKNDKKTFNSVLDYPAYKYWINIEKVLLPKKLSYESLNENKPIVWQFWWQGIENAPNLVKVCMASVCKHTKDYCDRIILTKENIQDYIEIPNYIHERIGKQGGIPITQFSDYLRISLLEKYGGIWIDATCYMTQKIPKDILSAELFYFKTPMWISNETMTEDVLNANLLCPLQKQDIASGSNWFISGKRGNYVLGIMKKYLEMYWKNENHLLDYFLFHHTLSYVLLHYDECMDIYMNMPTYSNIPPHLMQFSINKDEEKFIFLSNVSFVHKLTYFSCDVVKGTVYHRIVSNEY